MINELDDGRDLPETSVPLRVIGLRLWLGTGWVYASLVMVIQ
jgi:hypothetical protein